MKKISYLFTLSVLLIALIVMASCSFPKDDGNAPGNDETEETIVGVEGLRYELTNDGESYAIVSEYMCNAKEITLPTEYEGKPVKYIGSGAFKDSSVEKVIIPEGYVEIYSRSFMNCSVLKSIELPETLIGISGETFKGCTSIEKINIPDSVTYINSDAFYGCSSLTEVTVPESVTYLGSQAFGECSALKTVNLGDNIIDFSATAFDGTPVASDDANFVDGVRYIGNYAVSVDKDALPEELTVREGTVSLAGGIFSNCGKLKKVVLPESMLYVGGGAFSSCSNLAEVKFPDSIISIGYDVFNNVPHSVYNKVGEDWYVGNHLVRSFRKTASSVSVREGTITVAAGVLDGIVDTLYLPASLKSITYDDLYGTLYSIGNIVVSEENENYKSVNGALYNKSCTRLIACSSSVGETFVMPETVEVINPNIFCPGTTTKITTVVLPKSVTEVGSKAFAHTTLKNVYYCGTAEEYKSIIKSSDSFGNDVNICYYSEAQPTDSGYFWHYVDAVPTLW
ncbi:MAG: leucine-rich repeat domain-containing protein [Ruminococcaceae bacterium]|nr:leucine-rich repeat domain-containing protein [Oscillospiraceae bacterium]